MTKKEEKRLQEIGAGVYRALSSIFDEESEFYVKVDNDELTLLFHAMSTTAPNILYKQISGDERNNLEYNHLMNKLCFQYSRRVENDD